MVPLGPADFAAELNRRWRGDPSYRDDIRFVVAEASAGAGTTWEGPESMKPTVLRVVARVVGELPVAQPFLIDR